MRSEILRRRDNTQISFNLPHRIYETCVYPRFSPNGSTVILYAHEEGLRVIWYGGKKFKTAGGDKPANGDTIDLTDTPTSEQEYEEEQQEEDEDPSQPAKIPHVLTHLDVPLGTACTRLAIPPIHTEQTLEVSPEILDSHIVVMLAGADQSLKLVTLPLKPKQQHNNDDVQIVNIVGPNSHQDIVSDVAITLTAESADTEESENRSSLRTGTRYPDEAQNETQTARNWSLLLASVSPTGHGLLLTHQIPIDASGRMSTDTEDHVPIQRHHLRSSLSTCRIKFNTSLYPAQRHSHLLLSMANTSSVKIFDLLPQAKHSKLRRGSTNTVDSLTSATRSARQSFSVSGRPLITLLPPFAPSSLHDLSSRRKTILDAAWALQGQAIIVLLKDGEWGLWDLEAAGPASAGVSNNLVKGQGSVLGIHGGSLSRFAVGGTISSGGQTSKSTSSKSMPSADSSLAPMTPHTRKIRSEGLFKGSRDQDMSISTVTVVNKGTISVTTQIESAFSVGKVKDEAILFSYGSQIIMIRSILAYWRSGASGRSAPNVSNPGRPVTLSTLIVPGEELATAQLLPSDAAEDDANLLTGTSVSGFVVATQSRLVLSLPSLSTRKARPAVSSSLPMRLNATRSNNIEQTLLESGELDIDGMDRILSNMANSSAELDHIPVAFGKKSVNFHFDDDDDDDVDMSTPTVSKSTKSKLIVAKGTAEPRRLFS